MYVLEWLYFFLSQSRTIRTPQVEEFRFVPWMKISQQQILSPDSLLSALLCSKCVVHDAQRPGRATGKLSPVPVLCDHLTGHLKWQMSSPVTGWRGERALTPALLAPRGCRRWHCLLALPLWHLRWSQTGLQAGTSQVGLNGSEGEDWVDIRRWIIVFLMLWAWSYD